MKRTGIIVLLVLLILIGIPLILLNTSYFQQRLVDSVTKDLNQKTGTKIYIEDSDISLFRGLVFHHVQINDSLGHQILKAERFDAEVRIIPLLSRRLELNALRLICADIHLWRNTPKGKLNIQPIIDAFKKPNKKTILPWHLDFSTILLRNSRIHYDVKSELIKTDGLDGNHLDFSRISAKLSLKIAPKKHYQLWIYKFQAKEKCGLIIDNLKFQTKLSENAFTLRNLKIYSANSSLEIDSLDAKYHGFSAFSNFSDSVRFNQTNIKITFVPSDFSFLNVSLTNLNKPVKLSLSTIGKLSELTCNQVLVNMDDIFLLNGKITLKGLPKIKNLYMNGLIGTLRIMPECLEYFSGVATNQFTEIPALRNLGTINYMGNINTVAHRWVLRGDFATAAGNVGTDIQLSPQNEGFLFKGNIRTDAFKMNQIFPDYKMLENIAFNVTVDGAIDSKNGLSGKIDGMIPFVFYNGYKYKNMTLNGQFDKMGMEGRGKINDENARLVFSGLINHSKSLPEYKFDILADEVNLQPLN
ncbi:MAG: AsmA family protein, partial [Bacteroidales bacterium]|nr:AsmA family protein [Bacteroidales bacterium]